MRCPSCDHDNIAGDDLCANCGMDLAGLDVKAWGLSADDPLLRRRVSELPIKRALTLGPEAPVAEAIRLMHQESEGCVFVEDEVGRMVGVVTERDVALRVAARGLDRERTTVSRVMTRDPFTVRLDDSFAFALHRMGVDGFRHVPVVDEERRLRGFLSIRSVLAVLAEL
ncbi:MAG TPA: CBS domain-containing protein [Thermoanaerobaculia bacterium]|nr:CBS domain-containing protein [Thermoanaerobaculia bacterium]